MTHAPARRTNINAIWLVLFLGLLCACSEAVGRFVLDISISPNSATAGDPPVTITVKALRGAVFESGDAVFFNRDGLQTTHVDNTTLTAVIPASFLTEPGEFNVDVKDSINLNSSDDVAFTVNPAPVPTITAIDPSSVTAGGPGFSLNISGTNFSSASTVQVNGVTRSSQFANLHLFVAITAADIASAGSISITVTNPGNQKSNAVTLTVTSNPVPAITSISPSTVNAGSGGFTLQVNGSSFLNTSTATVGGAARKLTFISSTQVNVEIQAGDIAVIGSLPIVVTNPAPGGGPSNIVTLTVTANPVPIINSLSPNPAAAGGPDFVLQVSGSNFLSTSTATAGGAARALTFVSSTQVNVAIKAADIATPGLLPIIISNPPPGGGASNQFSLSVETANPVPTITQLNPSFAVAGGAGFTLIITGTNFSTGRVITVNGVPVQSNISSSTEIHIPITSNDIQNPGRLNIVVTNPPPGGGPSNTAVFQVLSNADVAPIPVLLNLEPTIATVGDATTTLSVIGTGFVPTSEVNLNGTLRGTTFVNPTMLTTQFTAADKVNANLLDVFVTSPAPGGGNSNVLFVFVNAQNSVLPTLVSISPSQVTAQPAGGGGFTMTLKSPGNFSPLDKVELNGSERVSTFVDPTTLTANILDSDVTGPGVLPVFIFRPPSAPGGPGDSNWLPLTIVEAGNPVPEITSAPTSAVAGGPAFVAEVDGTNFVSSPPFGSTVVSVDGFPRPTTFVSSTKLNVTILAEDIATPGTIFLTAATPRPGGGTSNVFSLTVTAPPGP